MCTDGIMEANQEYDNKALWLKDLIEKIETQDIQKIANIIMRRIHGFKLWNSQR